METSKNKARLFQNTQILPLYKMRIENCEISIIKPDKETKITMLKINIVTKKPCLATLEERNESLSPRMPTSIDVSQDFLNSLPNDLLHLFIG